MLHANISTTSIGIRPFYYLKRSLDRASRSCKLVKENRMITPVLCITMQAVASFCFSFHNTDKTYYYGQIFVQSELAMVQYIHRLVLLAFCFTSSYFHSFLAHLSSYRPFRYSAKDPGSSVISIHFYTQDSIEWLQSFYHSYAHSQILQHVAMYRSIEILYQNS